MPTEIVTAGLVVIGDEILSGRTKDVNIGATADFCTELGIALTEVRVVSDVEDDIIAAVNALRSRYTYVFTTGGIGPTHDDITADAIAAVFGRKIDVRADALALLEAHYAARSVEMNDGRRRMARIPDGAELILNPVSAAPGFRIDNVFVMAGVPAVMRGMLQDIPHRIEGGERVHASTIRGKGLREGDIAAMLGEIAKAAPDVNIGSYPFMKPGWRGTEFGVNLVARGRDPDQVAMVVAALAELVTKQGAKPEIDPKD